ncbi:MAG TPA: DUF2934 domain-containing protein [Nitrospira sp.]|nr:DUF2934 domain-containing protein [Nitrospira sp.]
MKKREAVKKETKSVNDSQNTNVAHNGERHQLIAIKAYELYERRGCTHGHDLDDWLQAEAILNGQNDRAGA